MTRQWNNLSEITRYSIEQAGRCGCNSPLSAPLGSGVVRVCSYHEGMEDGIDLDRQNTVKIIEAFYEEGVIDEVARNIVIKELEENY